MVGNYCSSNANVLVTAAHKDTCKSVMCSPSAVLMSLGNLGLLRRLSNRLLRTKSAALGPP